MRSNQKYIPIADWPDDDRPREKFIGKGRSALSNAELIALLLGNGTRNVSAVDLGKSLLQMADNDLVALGKLKLTDLTKVKGIGMAKAVTVAAALELGRRRKAEESKLKKRLGSAREIFDFFNPEFENLSHEEFWIILLNRNLNFIRKECISKGGLTSTIVDVQQIMKQVIEYEASNVVLAHNHPSGNLKPSAQDIELTKKIKEACRLFNVTVADHLIVTDGGFYSFADEGML
jgi:DNA repair protein RadC